MSSGARALAAATLAALSFGVAACGDEESSTTASTTSTASTTTAPEQSDNVNLKFGTLTPDVAVDDREGTASEVTGGTDLEAAAEAAGCELQVDLPDEGNSHLENPDKVPAYETAPPTSGDHYANFDEAGAGAFADGAFLDTPPPNRVVHSLEHGRVAVHYSPDLSEEDQLALKGLFDADRPGMLLFPDADQPYAVAATAWTQLLGCDNFEGEATLEALAAFRDEFRGRGPEPVPF